MLFVKIKMLKDSVQILSRTIPENMPLNAFLNCSSKGAFKESLLDRL